MPRDDIEYLSCHGEVIRTTDLAILVEGGGSNETLFPVSWPDELWIPRSCCQDGDSIEEGSADLLVAEWWLDKSGLV